MDGELKKFEEELERLAPAGLPDGLIARMEAAMAGWQDVEGAEEKVVPFPVAEELKAEGGANRSFWAAAAAVALLGAVVALFLPGQSTPSREAAQSPASRDYAAVAFEPTHLDRNIVQASDGGLVFTKDDRPHRVMRIEYVDRIEFRNEAGEELHVQKPSVNLVLIPVRTD